MAPFARSLKVTAGTLGASLLVMACSTSSPAPASTAPTAAPAQPAPAAAPTASPVQAAPAAAPPPAPAAAPQTQASPATAATFPMTINHDGNTLTFTSSPNVLVDQYEAVYPVAAAGGNQTGKVVAITEDANSPLGPVADTLTSVPRLSTFQSVSREVIIGQKPDLVITHGYSNDAMTGRLAQAGIKTMIVNVCWDGYAAAHGNHVGFDAIYDDVTTIGNLLGTQGYAAQSVASLQQNSSVQQKAKGLHPMSVAVTAGVFSGSFFTYGPPSIVNTQIQTLGMTNAFADLTKRGESVSPEAFVARDPDFLVLGYDPPTSNPDKAMQEAMAVPGFSTTKAVQQHHILVVSDTFLLGRAVDGLRMMYDAIAAT